MKFRLWLHRNDTKRFAQYTPLAIRRYNGGLIYTAEFNDFALVDSLRKGFVIGKFVPEHERFGRHVLVKGNTQYEEELILADNVQGDLNGFEFVKLRGRLGEDFVERIFQTYRSHFVEKSLNSRVSDNRFILYGRNQR